MEIDAGRGASRPRSVAAAKALWSLLSAVCLAREELGRLPDPDDPSQVERALRHELRWRSGM